MYIIIIVIVTMPWTIIMLQNLTLMIII